MPLKLDTPVKFIKGVGPKLGDLLHKKGINSVQDLLEWYPRAYEDRRAARNIASLKPDDLVSLRAEVLGVHSFNMGNSKRKMYDVVIRDNTGKIHCKFFRVPYKGFFERFQPGQKVRVIGKVTHFRGQIQFQHPDIQDDSPDSENENKILPIYEETEGLSTRQLIKLIQFAIGEVKTLPEILDGPSTQEGSSPVRSSSRMRTPLQKTLSAQKQMQAFEPFDKLPQWLTSKYQLPNRFEAIVNVHTPPVDHYQDFIDRKSIFHKRIIFEEFFWLELLLAAKKTGFKKEEARAFKKDFSLVKKLTASLPFELTGAQKRALMEIAEDLARPHPMHRLVQGDVGSGKTLVALAAALIAKSNGLQSAIMVPTEILADQHFRNAQKFLEPLGVTVGLLTGSQKQSERKQTFELLKQGAVDFCVGTHALIQDEVEFKDLGLVIIDEQHRFGVHQRNALKQKGLSPHFLVMTATPIPRTLAMTVYGDLDVSVIDELPKGRAPIQTRVVYESKRREVMKFVGDQLVKGRQAYIVYPLVEESEKIDLKDAVSAFEQIQSEFPDYKVALLHGKMKPQEKDDVMRDFRDQKSHILVATTVIEVGVDVPNANIMVIEHAERFGLSQLHQLRGRVGRGEHKSFCILMLGKAVSDESRERSQIMERTTNGFEIAEADLELRGPGEFLGTKQSGLTGFKMANLVRDLQILQEARAAAFEVLEKDPELKKSEHRYLRAELLKKHGPTALASVG